jgi:hypothetical protein
MRRMHQGMQRTQPAKTKHQPIPEGTMKILLGITRTNVETVPDSPFWIRTQTVQHSKDMWEIELADDGSEYISRLWASVDGLEILNLPLEIIPAEIAARKPEPLDTPTTHE